VHDETGAAAGGGLIDIGGFVPFSTIDWPGKLAAVVFARGCPWNCPYCHNPHLLGAEPPRADGPPPPTWTDALSLLDARVGLLDGVVFSGGEPTAQPALLSAIEDVRARGFVVALHTNGAYPQRLRALLPRVDWVGLDIKAPHDSYDRVTRTSGSAERAFESLEALVTSGVPHEVRTTVHPDLLGPDDLERLAGDLEAANVTRWAIQAYRAKGTRPGLRPVRVTLARLPERVRAFGGLLTFREA